jgi:hypothetical protein
MKKIGDMAYLQPESGQDRIENHSGFSKHTLSPERIVISPKRNSMITHNRKEEPV